MATDLFHHHRYSSIHLAIHPPSSVPFAPDPSRSFVVSYLRVIGHGLSLAALSRSDDEFIGGSRAEWSCIWSTEWSACFVRKANTENEVFIGACHDERERESTNHPRWPTFPLPLLFPPRRTVFPRLLGRLLKLGRDIFITLVERPRNCWKFLLFVPGTK